MDKNFEFYRNQFFHEMRDILEHVNQDLLVAETDVENVELLNSIFRGIHTIKGSAGSFELPEISELAHHLESLLSLLRDKKLTLNSDMVDVILDTVDSLFEMLNSREKNEIQSLNQELVQRIKKFLPSTTKVETVKTTVKSKKSDSLIPDSIQSELEPFINSHKNVYQVQLKYTDDDISNGYDPLVFLKNLKKVSDYYYANPAMDKIPDIYNFELYKFYLRTEIYIATNLSKEEILDLTFDPELISVQVIADVESSQNKLSPELLDEFKTNSLELLESLESLIIEYEKKNSIEALNKIFRIIHTIKGDIDYVGIVFIKPLLIEFENLLDYLRKGNIIKDKKTADIILRASDEIKHYVLSISDKVKESKNVLAITDEIKSYIALKLKKQISPIKLNTGSDSISGNPKLSTSILNNFVQKLIQYKETLVFYKENKVDINELVDSIQKIIKVNEFLKISELDSVLSKCQEIFIDFEQNPENEILLKKCIQKVIDFISGLEGNSKKLGEILIEEKKLSPDDINHALQLQKLLGEILVDSGKVNEEDIEHALDRQELMSIAKNKKSEITKNFDSNTMRVDEKKIDLFSNLAGELIIARNTYEYLLTLWDNKNYEESLKLFKDNFHVFSRISSEIQTAVTNLRMTPVKGLFQKFYRTVRDVSHRQKKTIELLTKGEETEIDKKVSDALSDPLLHMIRNSCDHGIESIEERIQKGKPEKGTITLEAAQRGSNVIITIRDDGKGLNRKAIYDKAIQQGIKVNSIEDDSLFQCIFLPGFSTAKVITDVSGRGVGLDVVMTSIKELGGNIEIHSQEDIGTEFVLTLPMSMGITNALMVKVGDSRYAIPLENVLETVKIRPQKLKRIIDGYGFYFRGEVLPLETLENILNTHKENRKQIDLEDTNELSVVVLKSKNEKFAFIVDALLKNMELAIKTVPDTFSHLRYIDGVSILGDGMVVLVLNIEELIGE